MKSLFDIDIGKIVEAKATKATNKRRRRITLNQNGFANKRLVALGVFNNNFFIKITRKYALKLIIILVMDAFRGATALHRSIS